MVSRRYATRARVWESRIGKRREQSGFGNPKLHAFGEPPSSTRSCSSRDLLLLLSLSLFSSLSPLHSQHTSIIIKTVVNLSFQVLSRRDFLSFNLFFIHSFVIINQILRAYVCVCVREREIVLFGLELEVLCVLLLVG